MNLRTCALLLLVGMFGLANVAEAQSAKTKSKAKAKKSAKAPVRSSQPSPSTPTPIAQPAAQAPHTDEHKAEADVPRLTVEELKDKLAKNAPVFIIDSRSQGSYDNSGIKIKGAVRIPAEEIEARLSEIPRDREIVIYCT